MVQIIADLDKVMTIARIHTAMIRVSNNAHLSLKILSEESFVLKDMMMTGRNATKKYP